MNHEQTIIQKCFAIPESKYTFAIFIQGDIKSMLYTCINTANCLKVDMPILICIFFTFNWLTLTSEMHFVKFHPEVASCLLCRGKRKYAPLGMRLLWKYIRNYFLVYHLISHLFVISPKLQRIWSWNFGFAIRKIWALIWFKKYTTSGWALGMRMWST